MTGRDRSEVGWLWQTPLEDHDPAGEVASVPTALPCPSWCDLPAGHQFEPLTIGLTLVSEPADVPDPRLLRVHRRRFGDQPTHIAVETCERALHADGPSDLGTDPAATLIRVQFPHAAGYLTPTGARRMAELLLAAAETAEPASPTSPTTPEGR